MSTATIERTRPTQPVEPVDHVSVAEPVVALKRRTIDSVLIGFGVVATAAFVVAGGLLMWGHNFSSDYVGDELSSQNITFPSAADLTEEGRTDLVQYADQQLDTGTEAQAYASFINGHLEGIADGATYADLGATESAAKADVTAAVDAGQPQAQIDALQANADDDQRTAQQPVQGRDPARPAPVGLRLVDGRHDRRDRRHRRLHRRRPDGHPGRPRCGPPPPHPQDRLTPQRGHGRARPDGRARVPTVRPARRSDRALRLTAAPQGRNRRCA